MGIVFSASTRERMIADAKGKIVESLHFEEGTQASKANSKGEEDGYWVLTFEDGTEISFRFMAELVG